MKLYKKLSDAMRARSHVLFLKLKISDGTIPLEIYDLTNLQELYLEGNFEELPDDLLKLRQLKVLSLKSSRWIGTLSVPLSLPSLLNLKVIDTKISTLHFPLGMRDSQLTSLTLKNTHLELLPEEISQFQTLLELNLSGNFLTDLPLGFSELKKLKRLNLDSNKFQILPSLIRSLPNLNHLSLDQNPLKKEERARIQREFHLHF